ncbi:hypothetical protein [Streptosporangium vulgare]|uniref:hypothetical protein n=1 Tax=Streptosporangium vulgare TaxID=46190 RepID=UPI0031DA1519
MLAHGLRGHAAQAAYDVGIDLVEGPVRARREQRVNASTEAARSPAAIAEVQVVRVRVVHGSVKYGSPVPAPPTTQGPDQLGVFQGGVDRGGGSHGHADEDRGTGAEVTEQRAARSSVWRNGPVALADRPWPRASGAMTWWCGAKAGICASHMPWLRKAAVQQDEGWAGTGFAPEQIIHDT